MNGDPKIMAITTSRKPVLQLDEDMGDRFHGFMISAISVNSASWEDVELDEEEPGYNEEVEEDPEEEEPFCFGEMINMSQCTSKNLRR